MLAAERRDLLVTRLRRDGKLIARDLAVELGLSEDSVRRELFKHSVAACGAAPAEAAAGVSADLYFLGLGGIHPKEGLTTGDPDEAAMKRILVNRAADTYVVGSPEKLGSVCAYSVVRLSEVAGVITDAPGDDPTVSGLRAQA